MYLDSKKGPSRDAMRRTSLLGIVLTLLALVALAGLAPTAAAQETTDNDTDGNWIVWTNETTLDDRVSQAAISDADANGTMHVAYLRNDGLYYARLTLHGEVIDRQRLPHATQDIQRLHVTTTADGTARIVWKGVDETTGEDVIRYAESRNGSDATVSTIRAATSENEGFSLEDVATDQYGRTLVLFEYRVRGGGRDTASRGGLQLSVVGTSGADEQSATVVEAAGQDRSFVRARGDLAVSDGEITVLTGWRYFEVSFPSDRLGYTSTEYEDYVTQLHGVTFDAEPPGLRETQDRNVGTAVAGEGESVASNAVAVSYHPDGRVFARLSSDCCRNLNGDFGVLYDPETGDIEDDFVETTASRSLWDDDGRLYLWTGSSYTLLEANGTAVRQSGQITGFQDWALNGEGYPSLVHIVDGELRYRARVTRPAREYQDVYERVGSGERLEDCLAGALVGWNEVTRYRLSSEIAGSCVKQK